MTALFNRTSAMLAVASALVGGAIWFRGGLGMDCFRALIEIGPLLVIGFYLSLQPLLLGEASEPALGSRAGLVAGVGLSLLGAATLRWGFCEPVVALTLLVFGPAILIGQGFAAPTSGQHQEGQA